MKQTIKDAGLPTVDLFERKDVEAPLRSSQGASSPRPSGSSAGRYDDDGAPAPKAPRVTPPRPPQPSQPRARRDGAAATRREDHARDGRRGVHKPTAWSGLDVAFDVCDEEVEERIFDGLHSCDRGPYEMAIRRPARDGRRTGG